MRVALALTLAAAAGTAAAQDFSFTPAATQADFAVVSEDVIAVTSYKALGPAEAGGITGFSIGAYGSYSAVQDKGAWQRLVGEEVNEVGMVGLSARKGLPFGIDLGAMYSQVPGTDAKLYGGEVRWAVLPGGVATPAVAVRGSYVKLTGEDDLKANASTLDLSISKGFLFFTPYAGAGYVWGTVNPSDDFPALSKVDVDKARFFVGARVSLGFLEITPEFEKLGDNDVFNLRLSLGL
ncbi:MAG: hypothetical protein V4709_03715 [Pseudomonadota bacterium]